MKTEAYVCDFCNELKYAAEVVGVSAQEDMFNKLDSFKINPHSDRELVHLCSKCYDMNCVQVAERETNRRKDEKAYELKLKEMSFLVKSQCIANFNKKTHKKVGRKGN